MAAILIFTSCSGDEESGPSTAAPSISVSFLVNGITSATAAPGDSISFALSATAEGGINRIFGSGLDINKNDLPLENEGTTTTISVFAIPSEDAAGQTLLFSFILVDDINRTDTAEVSIPISELTISEFETVLIGGQNNTTLGSFYDAASDSVYSASNAFMPANQPNIDFVFWYGATSLYAIGSTLDATAVTAFNGANINLENLTTRNATLFKALDDVTVANFDAVFSASGITDLTGEVGFTETKLTALAANDIFAIQLSEDRGSKYGIVKVVSTAGTAGGDRVITLDVKIEN